MWDVIFCGLSFQSSDNERCVRRMGLVNSDHKTDSNHIVHRLIESINISKLLNILLVIVLCLYVIAGVYTALPLILDKIPTLIFEDFLIYQKAVELTFRGANPFRTTGGDTNFFYPPPSLLVVEVFSHIKPFLLKVATYTTVNILLVVLMVRGVAKKYDYGIRDTWYWYVLCLGFAPFLELLTIGQINVLTMFGIFVLFFWENRSPIIAGLGLALAIITKVTPVLLFGYLLFNQKYRVILITVMWVLILIGATALRYGFSPLIRYPAAFQDLTDTFVLDKNSQSLVAKLVTIAMAGQPSPISNYIIQNYQDIQTFLMGYLFLIICASILIAFFGKQPKEPVFIITVLAMMLSPNVMWYHHYVFVLLPLLIWMGWSRLDKRVVVWCLVGLFTIQLDRWSPPYGLFNHLYCHISLIVLLTWQIKEFRKINKREILAVFKKKTPA